MQMTITINSREVESVLANLHGKLVNREPLMASIAAELLSITDASFSKEADTEGNRWKPLASSTIRAREKAGNWPGKILHGKGTASLRDSISSFSDNNHAGISTIKPYAAIHQFGGNAGRGKKVFIPSRPYMPIKSDGDNIELMDGATKSILRIAGEYFSF